LKTKKDRNYSFIHTKRRLSERYGIDIDIDDYEYLCAKISNNDDIQLIMMEKQKNDIQYTYDLEFKYKRKIRVVWSHVRNCITTALKKDKNE